MGTKNSSVGFPSLEFGYVYNSSKRKGEKCLLNPITKRRRRLRPLVELPRRPSNRKMLERPLLERRKKFKPREQLTGKRKPAKPSAKDSSSSAKWIRMTTPQLNYYLIMTLVECINILYLFNKLCP